jgi:hypothetical protein
MMRRVATALSVIVLLNGPGLVPAQAQDTPHTSATAHDAQTFDLQQLDALLAPIALYPDDLVTQILMASTFPLEIVDAARWAADPSNKTLTGPALETALEAKSWDPSVKSIVALPQILSQMNNALDWMQQVGYAFSTQQKDVLDSVQRLRTQAQAEGNLTSTAQQTVIVQPQPSGLQTIIIQPAQPGLVYVPAYSPTVVYGVWPYPSYPPVILPPPPGAVVGTAVVAGLAFGAGVAITAGLWGWAQPNWNRGNVNVNVNHYNNINVNRTQIHSNTWNSVNRQGAYKVNRQHPPMGPVGRPVRGNGFPANAIGRPSVNVPGNLVNRPRPPNMPSKLGPMTPGSRPNSGQIRTPQGGQLQRSNLPTRNARQPAHQRQLPAGAGAQFKSAHSNLGGGGQRNRPSQMPQRRGNPGGNAFGGVNQGSRAGGFGQRGQQSRQPRGVQAGHQGGVRHNGGLRGR